MLEEASLSEGAGRLEQRGRAALAAGEWQAAHDAFQASLDTAPSAPAFEGLGLACRWLGEQETAIRSLQRAYRLHRRADDRRGAARVALQLCLAEFYFHDDMAVGLGWVERADRLLEGMPPGAEQGWLALVRGHLALQVDHDPVRARTWAAAARTIGRDSGVVDVEMMALALEGLTFEQGDVRTVVPEAIDIMIALHACDTATDHAIHTGLRAGAAIIMCSPCCHKELRPQLLSPHPLRPILKHGVHLGQQAEMLTDGLRAMLLEACGYDTQVFEFVALEHTNKNKMILAVKRAQPTADAEALWQQIADLKGFYGIQAQCLETLLAEDRASLV